MSNINRPRTGLKPCAYCQSTDRDSNGQCHCRNVLYRVLRTVPADQTDRVKEIYTEALNRKGGTADKALAAVRAEFPAKQPADRKKKAPKKGKKAPRKPAKAKADAPTKEDTNEAESETPTAEKEALAAAREEMAEHREEEEEKPRYVLVVDDFEETKYARKDAAIKNGVRSRLPWKVVYKGKTVAQSDDVL